MTTAHPLLLSLEPLLEQAALDWEAILDRLLQHFDCPVGTVHLFDGALLRLQCQRGLPPPLLDKVAAIPVGKGMAGIAAERREPVQVCNLQTDASGVVRPGARESRMEGSLAAPMLAGGDLVGVLGVAKPVEYEFTAAQIDDLMAVGRRLAAHLRRRG